MKKILFLIIFVTLFISCSIGPVPVYYSQPIVSLLDDTLEVIFSVPDRDLSGWNHYNQNNIGSDTVFLTIDAYETTGEKGFIEKIEYKFLVDGQTVEREDVFYQIPIEIEDKDTVSLPELVIIINEPLAYEIDIQDGYADNVGAGILETKVYCTDIKGESFTSVPIRKKFKVIKPLTY
ncbi:MAG: hypothetical protein ABIN00_03220 [candidate division WOR-3 bacterium]